MIINLLGSTMVTKAITIDEIPSSKIIEGHYKKVLIKDNNRNVQVIKISVEPNAQGLEHVHSCDEWIYILKGSMIDNTGEYVEGNLLFNAKGSRHAVKAGPEGYEIIVFFTGQSDANPHLSQGYKPDTLRRG